MANGKTSVSKTLGALLSERHTATGKSPAEIATAVEITPRHYLRLLKDETDGRKPFCRGLKLLNARKISHELGIPLDQIADAVERTC